MKRKLLLFFVLFTVSIGMWATQTTYYLTSDYSSNNAFVIDDETKVATVTQTAGHNFQNWFTTLDETTKQEVIDAMSGITTLKYASGSIVASADINDVVNNFTSVTSIDAQGIKITSTSGHFDVKDLANVTSINFNDLACADSYPRFTVENCSALTTLSMRNAFVNHSENDTSIATVSIKNNPKLTTLDLTGLRVGGTGGYGTPNLDFSGNTALTTLDLSTVDLQPVDNRKNVTINLDGSSALEVVSIPSGVNTSNVNGYTIPYSLANSILTLHEADDADKLVYWYSVTDKATADEARKNHVLNISLPQEGFTLAKILEQANAAAHFDDGDVYDKVIITGTLTEADVKALGEVEATVLDLSGATLPTSLTTVEKANTSVRFIVMPDGTTRDQTINGLNEATFAQFSGLFSAVEEHVTDDKRSVTGYSKVEGTLQAGFVAAGFQDFSGVSTTGNFASKQGDWTRNGRNPYSPNMNDGGTLTYVTLSGLLNAFDIANGSKKVDANGHFEWDQTVYDYIGDDPRTLQGDLIYGGLTGATMIQEIDLEKAVFLKNSDMTLSYKGAGILYSNTWKVVIPTDSRVKETPAFFIDSNGVKEICIPSNIETIRTHFAPSLDHIWTTAATGDAEGTTYDNGVYDVKMEGDKKPYDQVMDGEGEDAKPLTGYTNKTFGSDYAGTYTFSSNLKLIETQAFANSMAHVTDVYVLAEKAPECHVDAFPSSMYVSYSGYAVAPGASGTVERGSFRNGDFWLTMLHYPRDCKTPEIQRYTDPTREYSIATGLTDGKGATIYFPQYGEFLTAFIQGTYGYTWKAFDVTRNAWGDIANVPSIATNAYWSAGGQATANSLYVAGNPTATFYDTTLGGNTKPSELKNYWEIIWEDEQLYPQAETETVTDGEGNVIYDTVETRDANGNLVYESAGDDATWEGNYIKYSAEEYVKADDGTYYHPLVSGAQWNTPAPRYTKTTQDVADPNGDYIWPNLENKNWYTTVTDWLTWDGSSEEKLAEMRANGHTFSKKDVYTLDANGTYYISSEYKEYAEGASDYVDGINTDRYNLETVDAYRAATSSDEGPFYKVATHQVARENVIDSHDYRGWHQFVLTGYAANTDIPMTSHRSYLTDTDWWTICLPYDLTRKEMILFYGDKTSGKIPYLSILSNVVRDMKEEKITLNFSDNLMNNKATKNAAGDWEISTTVPGDDDVVLHKGVPYLIKPNFVSDNRQFDIYGRETANNQLSKGRIVATTTEYPGLYEKLVAAEKMDPADGLKMVEQGIITVPALVANLTDADAKATENVTEAKVTYNEVEYPISAEWDYTFVGSFYKSMIPAYSYYLGWDKKAMFFYAKEPFDVTKSLYNSMKWNNNTALICPNMLKASPENARTRNLGKGSHDGKVTRASGSGNSLKPAQWSITLSGGDDLNTKDSQAKGYSMGFGGIMTIVDDATGIDTINTFIQVDGKVYSIDGRYVGDSMEGQHSGIYVKNGKKYVVK